VQRQQSGTRTYDVNADGVAHYGLYPDWIEDLRVLAGEDIIEDMERGPEAYLQTWERAIGIKGDACRDDIEDLTSADFDSLEEGMSTEDVLWALGQPSSRVGTTFTYCAADEETAALEFDQDGRLSSWQVGAGKSKGEKGKGQGKGKGHERGKGHEKGRGQNQPR
jgi:hypothetical protein